MVRPQGAFKQIVEKCDNKNHNPIHNAQHLDALRVFLAVPQKSYRLLPPFKKGTKDLKDGGHIRFIFKATFSYGVMLN